MKAEDALPQELTVILDSPEFDDEAGIVIDAVEFKNSDLLLDFSFRYWNDETPPQRWQLTVSDYKEEKIVRDWTQDIALYKQHPLLLEHIDTYTELYFKGTTTQSQELFIDIYQSLLTLTEDNVNLGEYVLTPGRVMELSQQGYGLFARGSKTILMLYRQCLTKYSIHAYFVGERERSEEDGALKLFQIGSSYIIGRTFHFVQLK
ncbi:hypothetical protein EOD41_00135 [Mucilaginibacter limnophilus]|uniref:Uncharacterized protein n=1 Tax=Mucilaginibacter limnophilus TaxID=1932778 RepID=A0A3S2UNU8_9SPHI|nr:hypothetical protein [Mucilaginibacter limnophilus]RVU02385.1 hypothetical protein EOD41_00135 [Mucilaginibacter limnophilus]